MFRAAIIWFAVTAAILVPVTLAASSSFLEWRDPIYIAAGFAGILGLALLLVQPLLAAGWLPGVDGRRSRRWHVWTGTALVAAVVLHVVGLWITSPPDVIDALLLVSPTPFSVWGVIAMWTVFAAFFLVAARRYLGLRARRWRQLHTTLALVTVIGTVIHAVQIEGAMETVSKVVLCLIVVGVTLRVISQSPVWKGLWTFSSRD